MRPFIIWSMPRCASTTLMSLVNHAGGNCANEPFSNKNFQATYRDRALREPIGDVLHSMFDIWSGFKHTAHPSGWPFPDNRTDINFSILMIPGIKFVLLKRRNILKMVVSSIIAQQCNLWNCHLEEEREKRSEFVFQELNPSQIKSETDQSVQFINNCRSTLERSGNEFLEVDMEDVISIDQGAANRVLEFIGLKPLSKEALEPLLSTDNARKSDSVYAKIPNTTIVEYLCGSNLLGRLTIANCNP